MKKVRESRGGTYIWGVCFCFVDDLTLEEEAERKIGWMLKLFFAGTATYVGYQFFPYMGMSVSLYSLKYLFFSFYIFLLCVLLVTCWFLGDTLIQQSVSLLHVKDPLFKRIGASRLSRFAIDGKKP